MREPTEAETEAAAEGFLRGAPCRSQYNGNECELDAGHITPHSHWIEGYGDLTWTDEQAEAQFRKTVEYWATQGVVWPPPSVPPAESNPARALVQRFEDLVVQRIAAGGSHVKGYATAKLDLIRALERSAHD